MPPPVIVWFRRDLRLHDNPALAAAMKTGQPVIPVFVLDETPGLRAPGAALLWWLDKSLAALSGDLADLGSRLVLRRGPAAAVITALVEETGATGVYWNRLYDSGLVARDTALKADLKARGVATLSCNGSLLIEPWEVTTKTGGPFKVFTPFWRAARTALALPPAAPRPTALLSPEVWPASERLESWGLHPTRPDWSSGFDWTPGEAGAHAQLEAFIEQALSAYADRRDLPASPGTSRLSPFLHWGDIGPRQVWRAVDAAVHHGHAGGRGVETFLSELGWREFNHHLLFHQPELPTANVRPAFDAMPWRDAPAEVEAWRKGQTGYPIVDAGMRQLWTTGWMHNRVRMIVASFLVKDLLVDWREGERWFWDTLVDADEASNAGNWQWVAGSGADAAPFFRIFNPVTQGEKFDPEGDYVRRWVPELARMDARFIHCPWKSPWPAKDYPTPIVDHAAARERALEALKATRQD